MIKKITTLLLIVLTFSIQTCEAKNLRPKKINVCKPVYTVQSGIYENYQIVKCGKFYGVKNAFSFAMVSPKYKKIENIDDKLIRVQYGKNQYGIMTYLGKTILIPRYKDVAISKIQLGEENSDDMYFGKINKTWFFVNEGKEIPIEKLKRNEKFEPVFITTLHKIPNKVKVDDNKYRLYMGTIKMGDLLEGTPVKIHTSTKLPKWADMKITDYILVSIFQKK